MLDPRAPHSNIGHTQNFLKSSRLVDRLLDRSSIGPNDIVVEIGPGKGRITRRLAERCRCVVAIELDPSLVVNLRERLRDLANVVLYAGDALNFPLPATPYKVFSSIPFNITAALISRLVETANAPEDAYLVLQREAANRIVGVPRETLFGISIKPWFAPSLVHRFAPQDFDPPPGVDVVMLRLQKRGPPLLDLAQAALFRDFVTLCFSNQRAMRAFLKTALGRAYRGFLRERNIEVRQGPGSTSVEQWLTTFREFAEYAHGLDVQRVAELARHVRQQQEGITKVHRTRTPHRRSRASGRSDVLSPERRR